MPLMPKRVENSASPQRGIVRGLATRANTVAFGEFGLQALEPAWLAARQLEAGRVAAQHYMGREGKKSWSRVFPDKPVTGKPAEVRMGSGKGRAGLLGGGHQAGHDPVRGCGGLPEEVARQALNRVAHKLPIRVRLVKRRPKL